MLFEHKIRRAMKWSHDRKLRAEGRDPELEDLERELKNRGKQRPEELPTIEELKEQEAGLPLEKGDLPALIGTALITIVPVCLLVLVVICLAAYFLIFGW